MRISLCADRRSNDRRLVRTAKQFRRDDYVEITRVDMTTALRPGYRTLSH